ncbi:hypothetical protein MGAST_25565 [Mycobacterium gastri 'Wayne']|nr:hypothetical protein MGAST_25565 [Mycobacterium gastri 'Wayne']
MLSVEDWAEIRRLRRAEGLSIKMIARVMGISKNTVQQLGMSPSRLRDWPTFVVLVRPVHRRAL